MPFQKFISCLFFLLLSFYLITFWQEKMCLWCFFRLAGETGYCRWVCVSGTPCPGWGGGGRGCPQASQQIGAPLTLPSLVCQEGPHPGWLPGGAPHPSLSSGVREQHSQDTGHVLPSLGTRRAWADPCPEFLAQDLPSTLLEDVWRSVSVAWYFQVIFMA